MVYWAYTVCIGIYLGLQAGLKGLNQTLSDFLFYFFFIMGGYVTDDVLILFSFFFFFFFFSCEKV